MAKMTTMEKLFVQIFERKNGIIEQVKQQTELYNQHLASKLLIDGITPPSWLWNPKFHSESSDPNDLKKEELISELLLPHPRPAVPYSGDLGSLHDESLVTGYNGVLSDRLFVETHASSKGFHAGDGQTTEQDRHNANIDCTLNCVPEVHFSLVSPQEQRDIILSDVYSAPDQSIASFQRSKSRQKALQLRNSAKAAAISRLSNENNTDVSSSGFTTSRIASEQHEVDKFLELAKLSDLSSNSCEVREAKGDHQSRENLSNIFDGCITRSGSSSHGHMTSIVASHQPDNADEFFILANHSNIVSDSCAAGEEERDCLGKENGTNSYCGRITSSRSSRKQPSGVEESFKLGGSSDISKKDSGRKTRSQTAHSLEGTPEPVNSSIILGQRVTRSRSGTSMKSPVSKSLHRYEGYDLQNVSGKVNSQCLGINDIDKQEGNAQIPNETEPVPDGSVEPREVCSGSNLDVASLRVGLEFLVSRLPSDCSMFLEPKQLDYNDTDECNLNEVFSPMMGKRMEKSSEMGCTSAVLAALPHKVTSDSTDTNSLEIQSTVEPVGSKKTGDSWSVSSEPRVEESANVESNVNEYPMLKSVEKNIETVLQIPPVSLEPEVVVSNVAMDIDTEMHHEEKITSIEGFGFSPKLQVEEGEVGYEGRDKNEATPSLVRSLSKQETGDLKLVEEVKMVDPTNIFIDVRKQSCVEGNQNVICLETSTDWGILGDLACTKRTPQERKSNLGEDVLFTQVSVQSPHSAEENGSSCKLSECKLANKSLQQGRGLSSATQDSWPQFKRRKIEAQQTNFFSASPSFRVQNLHSTEGSPTGGYFTSVQDNSDTGLKYQDFPLHEQGHVGQSNVSKSPDVVEHQKGKYILTEGSDLLQPEEEKVGSEVRNKSAHTPLALTRGQLESSVVSSLTKVAARDCLVERVGTADPASTILEQDNPDLLRYENHINIGIKDDLTCNARTIQERKSHLGNYDILAYCSVESSHKKHLDLIGGDQTMPVFEGFIIDAQAENGQPQPRTDIHKISLETLDLPSTTIERASILEQLCKSASTGTPLSDFSTTFNLHRTPDIYQSVTNGLLEHVDLRNNYSSVNEVNHAFQLGSYTESLPYSGARFGWSSETPYMSPTGKLWERRTSNSDSSEEQRSLNPELTCFPIEEDPSISEENENTDEEADKIQEGFSSLVMNSVAQREPLAEITEACSNPPASIYATELIPDRGSLDSVNADVTFTGTRNSVNQKVSNRYSNRRRCTNEAKEDRTLSIGKHVSKKATESLHNRFSKPKLSEKAGLKKEGHSLAEQEPKRNNIVSNITSFVPLIQKKQAAAVCTGKRDIKVKALGAAEAAKRLEEKRQNERKIKKDALKLERARMEQENLRQMELKKKKKEEEQKKKDADIVSRKRVREEEERKEKERKRKRVEEARQQQREQEEKYQARKVGRVLRSAIDENANRGRDSTKESGQHQKMEKERGDRNITKNPETEMGTAGISTSDFGQVSTVRDNCEALSDCGDTGKATSALDKSPENCNLVAKTSREESYEISPYQCSDDEVEEEEDIPNRKFIPSWASKSSVALVISAQQKLDTDVIFPPESSCSMDEVLELRKLQLK